MMSAFAAAVEAVGWLGAVALLAAYALTSTGRLAGDGRPFQWLNFAGSAGLAFSSTMHSAWPSAALNAVWIVIGLGTLARPTRRSAHRHLARTDAAESRPEIVVLCAHAYLAIIADQAKKGGRRALSQDRRGAV
jgi:hypothetical protein